MSSKAEDHSVGDSTAGLPCRSEQSGNESLPSHIRSQHCFGTRSLIYNPDRRTTSSLDGDCRTGLFPRLAQFRRDGHIFVNAVRAGPAVSSVGPDGRIGGDSAGDDIRSNGERTVSCRRPGACVAAAVSPPGGRRCLFHLAITALVWYNYMYLVDMALQR